MIKSKVYFLYVLVVLVALASCERPPELPIEPNITFDQVIFKKGQSSGGSFAPDSLIIKINFEDGDGDLGLSKDDTDPPYNEFDVQFTPQGDTIKFGAAGQPDYSIFDWLIIAPSATSVDTVRVIYNENFKNIFLDFYYKNASGDYVSIDFFSIFGNTASGFGLDGRFPVLNTRDVERPLKGTLIYKTGLAFSLNPIFRNETLRVDVQIQDRTFHKSNIISSPDFKLK